jgi:predicted membrane channel-forming protein YqfA (hemolysin III family)
MAEPRYNPRALVVCAIGLVALAVTLFLPPLRQWRDYHDLADARACGLIPNFLNVASNLPFLVVGLMGLAFLSRSSPAFRESWERGPYAVLMMTFILVFFGSSLYHWNPTDRTLFWDRIPLALVFSSILGLTVIERVSPRWGARLFAPLLAAGVASVLYWHWGNAEGRGDLRFYVLVQGSAILAVPLLMALFPPRYTGGRELLVVVALYGVAKIFETFDKEIFAMGHLVSGHTMKHLLAGLAAWQFLSMLKRRRPVETPAPAETLVAPAPPA